MIFKEKKRLRLFSNSQRKKERKNFCLKLVVALNYRQQEVAVFYLFLFEEVNKSWERLRERGRGREGGSERGGRE